MKRKKNADLAMSNAHVHFRTHAISRASGTGAGSTPRAGAYQTATTLVHYAARLCSVSLEHRKALNKGIVTEELRQALEEQKLFTAPLSEMETLRRKEISPELREMFKAEGMTLSERLTFYPSRNGVTIRDRGPGPKTANDPERKRRADPGTRQTYRLWVEDGQIMVTKQGGVSLSKAAVAEKSDKRGYWTIRDGNHTYQLREFTRRLTNPETGRREVAQQGLDVFGDKTFSYAKKKGVLASWLEVPGSAPDHVRDIAAKGTEMTQQDLQVFMNQVEAADPSRDGRPAQSYELGFLRELSLDQNKQALRSFIEENFTRKGLAALVSIHEVEASDGKPNTHAHLLVPSRPWDAQGNFTVKGELLSDEKLVKAWRKSWADQLRDQLTKAGINDVQIDHRTYAERGIEKTPGVHLGYEAGNMEQRGEDTEKGRKNRRAKHDNALNRPRKRKAKRLEIDAPEAKAPQNLRDVANDQQAPPEENNRNQPKDAQGTADPPSTAWLRHQKMLKSYRYKSRLGVEVTLAGVRARVEKVREETEHENTILTPFGHAGELGRNLKDKDKDHER